MYKCGTWNYFVKQHTKEGEEPSEIGLMKSIFKSEKFELVSKMKYAEREGERTGSSLCREGMNFS